MKAETLQFCNECGGSSTEGYPCTPNCDCWGCISRWDGSE